MSWLTDGWQRVVSWWRGDVTRTIARLDTGDAVVETVRLEGPPAKAGHLRRVLRDPRLLPKVKATHFIRRPAKKLFSRDEARRLFSATLRTTRREVRDLLPDREQLARYGLPAWETEADVATALSLSVKGLRHLSIHRAAEKQPHYVVFQIPKRSGGFRTITAPKRRLRRVQRALLQALIGKLPVSVHAHGFVPGRSVTTNARPHTGREVVVKLDLQDFFHTVTAPRVRGLLLALGYGYPVAAILAVLCTEPERQVVDLGDTLVHVPVGPRRCVQGAPTSPALCNAVAHRMDRRLAGFAKKLGFAYTRYADDLTFSGDDVGAVGALLGAVRRLVVAEGFFVNEAKTRVMRTGGAQRVTGVTVNRGVSVSRQERRRIRAMIHRHGPDPAYRSRIDGAIGWVGAVSPQDARGLRARWRRG